MSNASVGRKAKRLLAVEDIVDDVGGEEGQVDQLVNLPFVVPLEFAISDSVLPALICSNRRCALAMVRIRVSSVLSDASARTSFISTPRFPQLEWRPDGLHPLVDLVGAHFDRCNELNGINRDGQRTGAQIDPFDEIEHVTDILIGTQLLQDIAIRHYIFCGAVRNRPANEDHIVEPLAHQMRNLDLQLLRRQSPAIKLHIAALPDQAVGDIVPKPNPCLRLAVRRGQPITSLIKELAAKQGSLLRRLAGSDLRCTILQQLLAPTPTVRINGRIMTPVKGLFLVTDPNQHIVFVHQQRVGESERADAVGDLADLEFAVRKPVARIGGQFDWVFGSDFEVWNSSVPFWVSPNEAVRSKTEKTMYHLLKSQSPYSQRACATAFRNGMAMSAGFAGRWSTGSTRCNASARMRHTSKAGPILRPLLQGSVLSFGKLPVTLSKYATKVRAI